jgi:hypothetical protein
MAVSHLARTAATRIAPGYMANRARRYERDLRMRTGVTHVAQRLLAGRDPIVQSGPFAGMAYPSDRLADIDAAPAKLLGSYEREIAWVFERAIANGVSRFIDIGCADGYYAVGMAFASPITTTFAYDISSSARDLCAATAVASSVPWRVRIDKRFTLGAVASLLAPPTLVLCDIEGAEVDLLDRTAAATLGSSTVVVEVHEDARSGAAAWLRHQFSETHDATSVLQQQRSDVPEQIATWRPDDQSRALTEFRDPRVHWLVFDPKAPTSS